MPTMLGHSLPQPTPPPQEFVFWLHSLGWPLEPPVEKPEPKPGSDGEKPDECTN